ncbi:M16 family metallopeptidase [Thioalbus denitrificans]|uniref:Zinc protease n=1 Tax=Thioalbus denitrificans TaxID=547122 RepID=A0A369CN54_9GAMM|nr:pitrilysin family protein [Thioalbus denitrificans]RCX33284.1 zinc protease [Thioalbus denitrificans]
MLKRLLLPALWAALLPWSAHAEVAEYTLDNGMKVIVKEDHRAPVVVSQVWYRVGSSYEPAGLTGISHMLEHMMFKGTEAHPAGEFSRIIAENGGSENAFTSRDATAYYQQLEKSRLAVSFELEADRMRNLQLPEAEFLKERQVVAEERRLRTEDDPQSLAYERFNALAYLESPYRQPVIGWMNDIQNYTVEDLRAWYRRWYAPNNAILVVVGDVRAEAVLALAREHFGPLAPSEPAALKPRREPEQLGERRVTVRLPARLPYLIMGYHVPVVGQAETAWEPYALAVLAGILDGGDSARLARELVRGSQVAASAGAGYGAFARLPGLFQLEGVPANGHGVAALEAAFRDQVRQLQERPVDGAELARVKAQVVAGDVFGRDSVQYQAIRIGRLESIGLDWRLMDGYVDRIRAVTAEQVRAVARKYLTGDNLTVAVLEPQPTAEGAREPRPVPQGGARDEQS